MYVYGNKIDASILVCKLSVVITFGIVFDCQLHMHIHIYIIYDGLVTVMLISKSWYSWCFCCWPNDEVGDNDIDHNVHDVENDIDGIEKSKKWYVRLIYIYSFICI